MATANGDAVSATENGVDIFRRVEAYSWDEDQEFQAGLRSILSSTSGHHDRQELTMKAKCFYFARKFDTSVDVEGYKAWKSTTVDTHSIGLSSQESVFEGTAEASMTNVAVSSELPASSDDGTAPPDQDAPYPTSFAHIVDLITKGEPVPGIKEIPDTVLEGEQSQPAASSRRKPWERGE
ncbi:MAG: hypothetical protein M1817_003657 [Caeruleum heppii]|nr:MAG: hypothetical protein M1817_003657 [Caeruleum heppii]